MNSKFYFKRGKAASWTKQNILLGPGEPGFELDTGKLKIGNGVDKWNDLPYIVNKDTLPDEIIYYIGKQDSLPEEGADGSICIVGEDIYIRANDKWTKLNTATKGEVEVIKIKDNDDGSLEIDGKKYDTIQEALKNVTNAEVALPTGLVENLTISAGQTITLDLNGTEKYVYPLLNEFYEFQISHDLIRAELILHQIRLLEFDFRGTNQHIVYCVFQPL